MTAAIIIPDSVLTVEAYNTVAQTYRNGSNSLFELRLTHTGHRMLRRALDVSVLGQGEEAHNEIEQFLIIAQSHQTSEHAFFMLTLEMAREMSRRVAVWHIICEDNLDQANKLTYRFLVKALDGFIKMLTEVKDQETERENRRAQVRLEYLRERLDEGYIAPTFAVEYEGGQRLEAKIVQTNSTDSWNTTQRSWTLWNQIQIVDGAPVVFYEFNPNILGFGTVVGDFETINHYLQECVLPEFVDALTNRALTIFNSDMEELVELEVNA
jgi:hypothetical protein